MIKRKHFVSIIVVNYNGKNILGECLQSLQALHYPKEMYEVIVVDNNSTDDSAPFIHKHFPEFYLVRNEENVGFVGGNQVGLRYANGEYIVLLNSDTKVDPMWLTALVESAEEPNVGIVNSKLYYAIPFLEINLSSTTVERSQLDGSGNFSPMGILLEDVVCSRADLTAQVYYGHGFYKRNKKDEISARWSKEQAQILVPYDKNLKKNSYRFTVHSPSTPKHSPTTISLSYGKKEKKIMLESGQVQQFTLQVSQEEVKSNLIWLVQNAGNVVFADGYGRDRGSLILRTDDETKEFYERDSAYFNKPVELLAFCGASCLIKRKVIESVGFFDTHYYMYYEDLDLSLRAWLAGWDIVYQPKSIVYHRHKASTNSVRGAFMLFHVEKNHLYFLLTFFPLQIVAIEFILLLIRMAVTYVEMSVYVFRDNLPKYELIRQRFEARMNAVTHFVQNIPYFFSKRRAIRYTRKNAKSLLFARMY